jgi:polynucleotide 5'-hydroxyl-kinase GRC3/NOL9
VNQTVEAGKTLLVDGPASVRLVSGKAEVLGFTMKHAGRMVIREGKRLPFFAAETANFDVSLGANATVEEVEGSTVLQSWVDSVEVLTGFQKKPAVAMVMGKADSGKTSFCKYLVNRLVSANHKVAFLDGDLGQSDIGPPCTVAYAFIAKPLMDLYDLKTRNAYFVGATSPSAAVNKTIEGMALMKAEILDIAADFVVVNTDGWVEGEEAAKYKLQLADVLEPDMVVCIQQNNELDPLVAAMEKYRIVEVKSSSAVKQRSMETRKNLRERNYTKYMRDAKVQVFPLNQVNIEGNNGLLRRQGEARDWLLGLYGSHRKFLGIGVLREVDPVRKALKVFTSVSAKPSRVVFGKVQLDENLREASGLLDENGDTVS